MKTIPIPIQRHRVFVVSPLLYFPFTFDTKKLGSHNPIILKYCVSLFDQSLCIFCVAIVLPLQKLSPHVACTLIFPTGWLLPHPHSSVETHFVLGLPHLSLLTTTYLLPPTWTPSLLCLGPTMKGIFFKANRLRNVHLQTSTVMKSVICLHRDMRANLTTFELILGF